MDLLSIKFFVFFAVIVSGYFVCPRRGRWMWLLAASMAFYLLADARCIIFLLVSIATSYGAARLMTPVGRRKNRWLLAVALLLNIGCLAFLKYYNYTASMLGSLLESVRFPLFDLVMPVGISYYTLTVAGYCLDVYHGKIQPERNILKYALFVSFFPQILQGPIPRYDHLAPQIMQPHSFNYRNLAHGMQLILWGLFKKMVIADRAAVVVAAVFDAESYIGSQVVLAAILFSVQLYADFSGCVDIVRGCSQCLGIELGENFRRPYFAVSIQDFWHRWHISLSSWLRDYVYIPLGGSRKGVVRQALYIMITFLVSGLWHGVGLQFVAWGLIHGAYQVLGRLLKPVRSKLIGLTGTDCKSLGYRMIQMVTTFGLVTFAWIFFRAESLGAALGMIASLITNLGYNSVIGSELIALGLSGPELCVLAVSILLLLFVSVLQEFGSIRDRLDRQPLPVRWTVYVVGIVLVLVFGSYGLGIEPSAFIYAQF